jgi:hypothetical protein
MQLELKPKNESKGIPSTLPRSASGPPSTLPPLPPNLHPCELFYFKASFEFYGYFLKNMEHTKQLT